MRIPAAAMRQGCFCKKTGITLKKICITLQMSNNWNKILNLYYKICIFD